MRFYKLLILFLFTGFCNAADAHTVVKAYPSHWWVGMQNTKLQIMLYGKDIANHAFRISYPGVKLNLVEKAENKNYVFLNIEITAKAVPGTFLIQMQGKSIKTDIPYTLKPRRKGNGTLYAQGVTAADFMYLLMPDRFSNGDTTNDRIPGLKDQVLDRKNIFARHGGDLQGIINHLDYLQQLGITTLWFMPVLENDMPDRSEHGYAFTDHYTIEKRLGGAESYKDLSDSLHRRGIKLVQDAVYNHVGLHHFTVTDPPMKDWLHQWPTFTQPNYKEQTHFDPHASTKDKKQMTAGWFSTHMPDLNQHNPYVANFLIQHAIWSVEEFGVDGWRVDTYIFNDLDFMNRCNAALIAEYPSITIFGEAWVTTPSHAAYFARNNVQTPFKSNLHGITDFPLLFKGIQPALTAPNGLQQLYEVLGSDYLYTNPLNNVIFLDNHDMTRFLSQVNGDVAKLKMGLAILLTMRGIPQLYYGTEVLMQGEANPDGLVRSDFLGGWPGDTANAFKKVGLTHEQLQVMQYITTLAQYRKKSKPLQSGQLTHYVPANDVYVYFRHQEQQAVMVVVNAGNSPKEIHLNRFAQNLNSYNHFTNVITGDVHPIQQTLQVPQQTVLVLELNR